MHRLLPLLLLSGCAVQWSGDYEVLEDYVTGQEYVEVTASVTYPKKQFMTSEEYNEYMLLPESMKEKMWETYKEREELEKKWEEFINRVIEEIL